MTVWPNGVGLEVFETIDSTNNEARRRAAAGHTGPTWLAAHRQTKGRGRQGRAWSSESGNLAATCLLPFQGSPAQAARLSFAVALAVSDTIAGLVPDLCVRLKWPNDVLANNRKVSGILLESYGGPGAGSLMLGIGIGINLAHQPEATDAVYKPASIKSLTGTVPDFDRTLIALAATTERWLAAAKSFDTIRSAWLARAIGLGETATARLPNETLTGLFMDLDANGALVLETPEGPRRIAAGDVFFPGAT